MKSRSAVFQTRKAWVAPRARGGGGRWGTGAGLASKGRLWQLMAPTTLPLMEEVLVSGLAEGPWSG